MRGLYPLLAVLALAGCAGWRPWADADKAWIDLRPERGSQLEALAVDDRPWPQRRYFEVQPGARRLELRYRFAVSAANVGGAPLSRDCRLVLHYDRFAAGERYRLTATGRGLRPWARLYDEHGRVLASAREMGCGAAGLSTK